MKLVLIGFMATGKTSAAPLLAAQLGLEVVEMDDLITKQAGRSIEAIFAAGGEPAFRSLETAVSQELRGRDNVVISTGGGVITDKTTRENLSHNAVVVELSATFETVQGRLSPALPRPLFKNPEQAKALYEERQPLYSKYAAIHVATDGKSVDEVVQEIVKQVQEL